MVVGPLFSVDPSAGIVALPSVINSLNPVFLKPSSELQRELLQSQQQLRELEVARAGQSVAFANAVEAFGANSPEAGTAESRLFSIDTALAARLTAADAYSTALASAQQGQPKPIPPQAAVETRTALAASAQAAARNPVSASTQRNRNPERLPAPIAQRRPSNALSQLEQLAQREKVLSGYFGISYLDPDGKTKVFSFALLPAIESTVSGRQSPGTRPGIMLATSQNIKKYRIPGWKPIYQNLGGDQTTIQLIGALVGGEFIGDKAYTVGALGGFLTDQTKEQRQSSYESLMSLQKNVVEEGRAATIRIETATEFNDKPFKITLKCLITEIEAHLTRGDRTYYAIKAIIYSYPTPPAPTTPAAPSTPTTPAPAAPTSTTPPAAAGANASGTKQSNLPTTNIYASADQNQKTIATFNDLTKARSAELTAQGIRPTVDELRKSNDYVQLERQALVAKQQLRAAPEALVALRDYNLGLLEPLPLSSVTPFDTNLQEWRVGTSTFRPSSGTGPGAVASLPENWDAVALTVDTTSAQIWNGTLPSTPNAAQASSQTLDSSSVTASLQPANAIIAAGSQEIPYKPDPATALNVSDYKWFPDGSVVSPLGVTYIPGVGVVTPDNRIAIADSLLQAPSSVLYPVRAIYN